MSELKSKHAFGSEANVSNAIQRGLIDEYDIIFFNEGKLGWLDKDKNLTMLKIPQSVQTVTALPAKGEANTVYICGSMMYFWTGAGFKSIISESSGGVPETVVDAKLDSLKADLYQHTDDAISEAMSLVDTNGNKTAFSLTITNFNLLNMIKVEDGQLIFIEDQQKIALDMNGKRTIYGQVIELANDSDRTSIYSALDNTFYFVAQTSMLWMYRRGNWIPITLQSESPVHIAGELPPIGQNGVVYVNKIMKTVSIWDDSLSEYIIVANAGIGGGEGIEGSQIDMILEQITVARQDAIQAAKDYTIQQTGLMELSLTTAIDQKVMKVQNEVDVLKETKSEMENEVVSLQTTIEATIDEVTTLRQRIDNIEENGTGGSGGTTLTFITNEEIDALFKVY